VHTDLLHPQPVYYHRDLRMNNKDREWKKTPAVMLIGERSMFHMWASESLLDGLPQWIAYVRMTNESQHGAMSRCQYSYYAWQLLIFLDPYYEAYHVGTTRGINSCLEDVKLLVLYYSPRACRMGHTMLSQLV
ncbi:hypothetical protein HAX54_016457, partial [Datura stramonium]|nr:hypothetical protein [Datura stramonium]